MGWHDCPVHAMAFIDDNENVNNEYPLPGILFDLDYIFRWELEEQENIYRFHISPCTLFFENVFDYEINLISPMCLPYRPIINDISLDILCDEPSMSYRKYQCHINFHNGGIIKFQTTGYKQYTRKLPILSNEQFLAPDVRGGISFDRKM